MNAMVQSGIGAKMDTPLKANLVECTAFTFLVMVISLGQHIKKYKQVLAVRKASGSTNPAIPTPLSSSIPKSNLGDSTKWSLSKSLQSKFNDQSWSF
jgi:hypothetical protein